MQEEELNWGGVTEKAENLEDLGPATPSSVALAPPLHSSLVTWENVSTKPAFPKLCPFV